MIIAIDGKSGAGKTTLMHCLAKKLKLQYLDTGKIYRAAAIELLSIIKKDTNIDDIIANDEQLLIKAAKMVTPEDLNHPNLITETIGKIASKISAVPSVRSILVNMQRDFAKNYNKEVYNGSVLCGRDIGSVILPDADCKLFIDANVEVRAKRRHHELQIKGINNYSNDDILNMLKQRDERDSKREAAPLVMTADAKKFDTTNTTIDQMCDIAVEYITSHIKN